MSATQATDAPAGQPTARPEQPDVFLSYSRKDSDFARRLGEALAARDKEVWADWEDIPATAEWRGEIASGIDAADSFAFVISPHSIRSEECGKELAHALEHGKRIVPLLYRDANGLPVPPELASRNWIFFRAEDNFEDAVDTFVEALETDLDWVRAHTRLLVRAREWEARNHDKSLLLRGSDLREAEHRLATVSPQAEPQPTPLQREYTLASRRAQSRRQRMTLAAVGIALGVTVILAVLAWIQRNDAVDNARTARSRELATAAAGQLENDPELSVLLARQAIDQKRTAEAENVLRRALSVTNVIATTVPHRGWVAGVSFSRDGRRLLTASRDATARISDAATGRRLVTFRGHKNWVPSAVFSPDERRVVTASGDGTARIWDAQTGKQLLVLSGHRGRVTRAEFSRDGGRVLTCGLDHTARIWDAQSGEQLVVLRGHTKWVTRAFFDASGTRVATGSDDGTARIWDACTGKQLQVFDGGGGVVLALALSPDGTRLATGTTNGTARLWRVAGGPPIELGGHVPGKLITYAAFSPDGARLATGSFDTSARVWDGRSGKFLFELRGHTDAITSIAFSSRDGLIATASGDATAKVWDANGELLSDYRGHRAWLTSVTFSTDGRRLATGSADETAKVWDTTLGAPHAALRTPDTVVATAEFSRDARFVVTGGVPGGVWNAETGRHRAALLPGGTEAFSPDGRLVGVVAPLGQVALHDARTGRVIRQLAPHDDIGHDIEFSPDGRLLATTSKDGAARIFRVSDGTVVATLRHDGDVRAVAFSGDGRLVATASYDNTARVWDAQTGRQLARVRHAGDVDAVDLSPDGKLLASAGVDSAVRLTTTDGKPVTVLRGYSRPVKAVSFSDDGRLLVTASTDNTARVWSVASHRLVAELRHPAPVIDADFGPGGQFVATAGDDGNARIWEVATGRLLATLWGSPSTLMDVDFAPNGRAVVAAGFGDAARVYTCDVCGSLDDLLAFADRRVRRELTPAERALYLHERSGS
jgi:WD40 repeat protein